jgi:hypothetical protein
MLTEAWKGPLNTRKSLFNSKVPVIFFNLLGAHFPSLGDEGLDSARLPLAKA